MIDDAVLHDVAHNTRSTLLEAGSDTQFASILHLFDRQQQVFDLHFGHIATTVRGKGVEVEITQHPLLMLHRPVHVAGYSFAHHGIELIKRLSTSLFLSAFFRQINAF